jgi:hypothetical protein
MDITIICNQTDCKFNRISNIKDYLHQCTHPHPAIQFYGGKTGTICNSKSIFIPAYPPICAMCDTQESAECINCCHKSKTK